MTDASASIEVRNVSVTYVGADRSNIQALDDVSFDVGTNEFVSVIGPSGCGKSTLLKVIGDLIPPSSGSALIGGRHPREIRESHNIGHMFQDSVLLPWKKIRENIRFLCEICGKPITDTTIENLAELMGLGSFLNKYPHELSGGMRQRAALARAYALDPLLFLMDEPFGALDEITRHRMTLELMRIWHERRKTVLFVTHSIEEATFLSDKVIVLSSRPGHVDSILEIDLPRPRTREMRFSPEMGQYVSTLHATLEAAEFGQGEARRSDS